VRKKHDGSCVTRLECAEAMEPMRGTLAEIKNALIGKDLTGGLVQQVNNLNSKVENLITQWNEQKEKNKEKRAANLAWKLAAVGFASAVIGIVLEFVFSHFPH
jgi:hypothetical protein